MNRARSLLLLVLSLLLAGSALAQTTVTLMQGLNGYAGTADTRLINSGAQEGSATTYGLINESSTSLAIRFAIFQSEGGPVPNGATITSATLSMYKSSGPASQFKASRLLKNWTEMGATWSVTGTGASWTTAGAMSAGNDYLATPDGQASIGDASVDGCTTSGPFPEACWLHINVTSGVQAFASGTPNFGWKVADSSGVNGGTPRTFNSRDNNSWTTLRPKLTVTYGGSCTPPTAQLTASPTSGPAPLAVTFNASGSTDGSSAITSLRLQFGDGQEVTWADKNQPQSHTYNTDQIYTATLTATNACGTSAPVTRTITVASGPVGPTARLVATPQSGTEPLSVDFDASGSTQGTAAITSLRLQFGHNAQEITWTDKNIHQSHTYPAGSYTATLTVTDSNNLSSSDSRLIQVDPVSGDDIAPTTPAAGTLGIAVPTFHSMSLYYNPATPPSGGIVWMRYRRASEPNTAWHEGYPLWYDARTFTGIAKARGSAVHLQSGTKYYFEFGTGTSYAAASWQHHVSGRTWNTRPDNVADNPAVETIAAGTTTLTISTGGDAVNGYKVYDGWNGASMNVRNVGSAADNCINVTQSYVVIRRVVCRGGKLNGIQIADNVTNVVIEDVEVTDFAQAALADTSWGNRGENDTGAVRLGTYGSTMVGNNSRIVVQRSKLHTPRWGARPWNTGGAPGPYGIFMEQAGQQNVFRYNEIYSTGTDHQWFQDGIGGSNNFSDKGAPGADSDIYQNIIQNVYDDGIEAEGGGRNVRIWGNYINHVSVSIATATVHHGPTYVWRNVMNRHRHFYDRSYDLDDRNRGFKNYGSNGGFGGGRKYFFHNTFLQTPGSVAGATNPLGAGNGNSSSAGTQSMQNTFSYNNIYHVWKSNWSSIYFGDSPTNDNAFDYDFYNGPASIPAGLTPADGAASFEQHGRRFVEGDPNNSLVYKPNHGWSSAPALGGNGSGNYQLETTSVGFDAGKVLPSFNDGFSGTAPDAGAHESGSTAMTFGISATP